MNKSNPIWAKISDLISIHKQPNSARNKLAKIALVLATTFIVIWLIGSTVLYVRSPAIIFKTSESKNQKPDFKYDKFFLKNKAGNRVENWWVFNNDSQEVVLYLHGNAGRVLHFFPELSKYASVLSPTYPGYSESEGSPTTENIYETVDLVMDYLHQKGFKDQQITIWGHSMGGSPAVYAGTKYPNLKKVVLVNTFESVQSMCTKQYSIFCAFGGGILNSARLAPNVKVKVRQYHDPNDQVVPYEQGEKLYSQIGSNDKLFERLKDSDKHNYFDILHTTRD